MSEASTAASSLPATRRQRNPIHEVQIEGTYAATGGPEGKLIEKPYKEWMRLDNEQNKKFGALHLFVRVNGFGEKLIKKKDPSYVRFITWAIVESKTLGQEEVTELTLMTRGGIVAFIEDQNLPVEPNLYDDDSSLITAVNECLDDEEAFKKGQNMLRNRGAEARVNMDKLDKLNEDILRGQKEDDAPEAGKAAAKETAVTPKTNKQTKTDVLRGII